MCKTIKDSPKESKISIQEDKNKSLDSVRAEMGIS
jgi:hypothetical protein